MLPYSTSYSGTRLHKLCRELNLLKSDVELADITNYYDRPAIRMNAGQEKECIHYRKKILNYLQSMAFAGRLNFLPVWIKMPFCRAVEIILGKGLLYGMFKVIYRITGARTFVMSIGRGRYR